MRHPEPRPRAGREPRGFTLIELLVVMAIIGILIAFLLVAVRDSVRNAESKATLSLITKLEVGVSERIEALLLRQAEIVQSHYDLTQIYTASGAVIRGLERAQVFAKFDLVKAEMPDVFVVQGNGVTAQPGPGVYPINFAAPPYLASTYQFGVPLGAVYGAGMTNTTIGMFGATYQAAAGIYKNLGYLPAGYDGADNNGDGFIDDAREGVGSNPNVPDPDNAATTIPLATLINTRLASHKHKTARSAMLYALLVEGSGPLGSVFSRDEFTSREVADTDEDGLPEFIDAWGEPIQFYRWPIFYNSDPTANNSASVQKGGEYYNGLSEVREVDPLDPNQMLVSLGWWLRQVNSSPPTNPAVSNYATTAPYSAGANAFMTHFHSLLDPHFPMINPMPRPGVINGHFWDRGGATARRAYFSRYLVLSGGPDKVPGTTVLTGVPTAAQLIGENNALIDRNVDPLGLRPPEPWLDDISNHGLASPGGGVR